MKLLTVLFLGCALSTGAFLKADASENKCPCQGCQSGVKSEEANFADERCSCGSECPNECGCGCSKK